MSKAHARPRLEIARAVQRLTKEPLLSLEELTSETGLSVPTLRRWIIRGKGNGSEWVWLDGFHRPNVGWMTSREAIQRFRDQLAAKEPSAA